MSEPNEFSEINALLKRVDKANPAPADIEQLRKVLTQYPMISRLNGDLASTAEHIIIKYASPTHIATRISIEKFCEYQRDQLGYKAASPLERLLIENVVISYLHLYVTQNRYESSIQSNSTFAQADYWERKLNAHQRRYLRAIETLARVRKMNINVQINIGDNQVITG